jgi:gamma-glutamyltranspeptidase/glutathione hydrolase
MTHNLIYSSHHADCLEKLPWRAVCNPAIYTARYGFPVTEDLVRYMGYAMSDNNKFLIDDPVWAIDFAPNGMLVVWLSVTLADLVRGTLLGLNEIITRKRYAE